MNYGSDNYSLLGELRNKKLSTSYDDQNPQMDTMADLNKSVPNDSWKTAAAQGAVQGGQAGIPGLLMGGGLGATLAPGAWAAGASAGPVGLGVVGAGLLLSKIEAKQKAKQAQEQAIAAEAENRKAQTISALNNSMRAGATVA
jgi:hypothetical protein